MLDPSHQFRWMAGLVCGLLLLLTGCGSSLESTVSGTVTHAGKPVPFAEIVFHPLEGGPLPYGVSMEDGGYEILSGTTSGLKAGTYKVVVQSTSAEASVPKAYGSVATSTLEYEIKPGKNVINIELK